MSHFWLGLFGALIGSFLVFGWQLALGWRKRRRAMSELDECERHTKLAAQARTHEEFEFHMTEAVKHFDQADR